MYILVFMFILISWRDSWLSFLRIIWFWRIVLLIIRGDKVWVIVVVLVYIKINRGLDLGIYLYYVFYGNGVSMV